MTVPADMHEFLKLAGDKLGITAKRVFSEQGTPIDDTNAIREDERVYISSGEAFWKYEGRRMLSCHQLFALCLTIFFL
jgi:hypothetical protein